MDDAPIPGRFRDLFSSEGIVELYPPQNLLVESGAMEGRNTVLSTPTASGKTFAAELLMAGKLSEGKKIVYVVPLKALAYEKYLDFKKYEKLGFKVRIEIGDLDSSRYRNSLDFDVLVSTAEKCDSILRSRPEWFENTGMLVLDEVHLIASDRGPVYEILAAKFRKLFSEMQILALSATIGNPEELSGWLDAELVSSEWRPVELTEKVAVGADKNRKLVELVRDSLVDGGQTLVFVSSRRSAESVAENLGLALGLECGVELEGLGEEILNALTSPTEQCRRLSVCARNGVVFHHAGITGRQRTLIEDAFREGLLKVIAATPTLAAGVNLPSRTVIVRDLTRYGSSGSKYIPVLEYKQQVGRAGRPKYDRVGLAYSIARNESEADFVFEKYVKGEIESIYSVLGVEPVLRCHVLASIASSFTRTGDSLTEFFQSTFFGFQYGIEGFSSLLEKVLDKLEFWGFIRTGMDGLLLPTDLGRRISELYIDPQTAFNYINLMQKAEKEDRFPSLGLLEMLCDSAELPLLYVKKGDEQTLWEEAFQNPGQLLRELDGFELDYGFLERYRTAKLLELWVSEASEEFIYKRFNIPPGMLYRKTSVAEWLAYSASEIARILELKKSAGEMSKMELRLRNGVREELVPLIKIKGIGRIRARRLYNMGYKKPSDLREADIKELASVVGRETARKIKTDA